MIALVGGKGHVQSGRSKLEVASHNGESGQVGTLECDGHQEAAGQS